MGSLALTAGSVCIAVITLLIAITNTPNKDNLAAHFNFYGEADGVYVSRLTFMALWSGIPGLMFLLDFFVVSIRRGFVGQLILMTASTFVSYVFFLAAKANLVEPPTIDMKAVLTGTAIYLATVIVVVLITKQTTKPAKNKVN